MTLVALAFWFLAVCNPDMDTCRRYEDIPMWGVTADEGWDDDGPYFTLKDCEAARRVKPMGTFLVMGTALSNPWSEPGESLCYARAIRIVIE